DQAQILAQQKASAVLTNSAAVTKAISINPSLSRKDFATFPMPSVNGKGIQPSVLAGSDWAIPSRSSNVALALKWIRIAASPLIQRKWIVEHDG
ncbi:sugar ABC transporter substrate-binding protein, partial [Gardnerella vaginalis]